VLKREKTIDPARIVRMLAQTALGLDEAHARQLVHRDLKPDNLFLCGSREGDTVKILDFGSVKDKNKDAKKLTVLGTTIGSPYYMAPEQAQGLETLDARADVFALAAITYECVTGMVPFTGNNGPSILLSILTKDPDPPSTKAATSKHPIPAGLDDVMEEALAKNPNIRTKSVGDFATAVGHAYGLTGDHKAWAHMPQGDLERLVAEGIARLPPPTPKAPPAALEAAADPFASPPAPPHPSAPNVMSQPQPMQQMAPQGGHLPNANPSNRHMPPPYPSGDLGAIPGLDSGRPQWLIPVAVGLAALVVGGGIAIVLAR
jgi:serine/threonine-protein kinase